MENLIIISRLLGTTAFVFCFYFTITFFQYLITNEEARVIKQTKIGAILSLLLSILLSYFNFILK